MEEVSVSPIRRWGISLLLSGILIMLIFGGIELLKYERYKNWITRDCKLVDVCTEVTDRGDYSTTGDVYGVYEYIERSEVKRVNYLNDYGKARFEKEATLKINPETQECVSIDEAEFTPHGIIIGFIMVIAGIVYTVCYQVALKTYNECKE